MHDNLVRSYELFLFFLSVNSYLRLYCTAMYLSSYNEDMYRSQIWIDIILFYLKTKILPSLDKKRSSQFLTVLINSESRVNMILFIIITERNYWIETWSYCLAFCDAYCIYYFPWKQVMRFPYNYLSSFSVHTMITFLTIDRTLFEYNAPASINQLVSSNVYNLQVLCVAWFMSLVCQPFKKIPCPLVIINKRSLRIFIFLLCNIYYLRI